MGVNEKASRRRAEKQTTKRAPSKKTPSKKTPSKQTRAKKTPSKKTPSKKTPSKKTPSKKTPSKKTPSKKAPSKKTPSKKGVSWPAFAPDRTAIRDAYAQLRAALIKDPLFIKKAAEFDVSIEDLDAKLNNPPSSLSEGGFWEWLGGADQYRYAGLAVLTRAHGDPERTTMIEGKLKVPDEATVIVPGNLVVRGDLELGTQAVLIVLGELHVTGSLIGDPADYSLVAGTVVRCQRGTTGGEIIALQAIVVDEAFYFSGNDYSARAPRFEGALLVDFERANAFRKVAVTKRLSKWDFDAAARLLGVDPDDDLAMAYRARLGAS